MYNLSSAASYKALTVSLEVYNSQYVYLCSDVQSSPETKNKNTTIQTMSKYII